MVHHPRRPGLLVSCGVNGQQGVSIPPLLGRRARYFFLLKSQPRRPGLSVSRGRMDSRGANAPAWEGWGTFAEFFRVGSNPSGGFFSLGPDLQDVTQGGPT